jgi:hypothetical protein
LKCGSICELGVRVLLFPALRELGPPRGLFRVGALVDEAKRR